MEKMEIYSTLTDNIYEENEIDDNNNNKGSNKKNKLEKKQNINELAKTKQIKDNDSLNFDDKMNFYEVQKKDIINYLTPIKVNNIKYIENKSNNKSENNINNNKNLHDELSNLFLNISDDNKNIMVSELDIELSNSKSNNYTDYKSNQNNLCESNNDKYTNNINIIKKRELEFKKEIEQNLKKFLKYNQENNNEKNNFNNVKENKIKDKLRMKMKLKKIKKQSHEINYCLTDISNKNSKYKNIQNSFVIGKNKLNFYHPYHNNSNFNSSFKNQIKEFNTKNNIHEKNNDVIKINFPNKRTIKINNRIISKMNKKSNLNHNKKQKLFNYTSIKENKNLIFNKKNDLSDFFIFRKNKENQKILNTIGNHFNKNKINKDFLNKSEKRNKIEKTNKLNYNSLIKFNKNAKEKIDSNIHNTNNNNIKDKNIIIQNFNWIDYNDINININNNFIKPYKLSKYQNDYKKSLSLKKNILNNYNNYKNSSISHNTIFKKENLFKKLFKNKNLGDSYIKKNHKNNTSLNNSYFKRINKEKKLTYKENHDNKNRILNDYLNKTDLIKNKLKYIKVNNNFQLKRNYNTINNNIFMSLTSKKRDINNKITKQKTFNQIENANLSNNNLKNEKFIRQKKEKRNTQICSNNIKKNLFKYINCI